MTDYVELRNGEYYVTRTRVPLACVIYKSLEGSAPEAIRESYPLLTLAQVYGAIAYYLDHKAAMDEHFRIVDKEFREWQAGQPPLDADLRQRLERARLERLTHS
jgi:uncharacterized protein (DUF433 family)